MTVCGDAQESFSLCPGRSSPELGSALFQLESFCAVCPELKSGYLRAQTASYAESPGLLSVEDRPELVPYKSLDADRLRLVGQGKWPMEQFLDGVLWLPFQEPSFLHHGLPIDTDMCPNFEKESPEECLKLALLWDRRGLLDLHLGPAIPNNFSRVFNAFKNKECDRQIGDRRAANLAEYHIDGPSQFLPQGQQLTQIRIPRFIHMIRGSMTDRRDFYHQAAVTHQRSQSNMLPFAYDLSCFDGTTALLDFAKRIGQKRKRTRETEGDGLRRGFEPRSVLADTQKAYPTFKSLFQGDHLGVEYALQSHQVLLEGSGLLDSSSRILGGRQVPKGQKWEALVIDDYFCWSSEPINTPTKDTAARRALIVSREVYDEAELLGSVEKDIDAASTLKAAGAEIRSDEKNVRLGVVPVGAPFGKRLALAVISLRTARLPAITGHLLSRLAGNWVSILQYRKCFPAA